MYNDGDTTPKNVQGISLGDAVAASACVPALFEPLPLSESYPDMVVRLADGGVHDNQGISSLLEQDCRILLVSDASGQTGVETNPDEGSLAVAKRSNDILMARVRAEQYRRLDMLRQSSVLGGMMFVHLKRDLADKPTGWIGCSEPDEDWTAPAGTATHTSYGIRHKVQRGLADSEPISIPSAMPRRTR